MSAQRAQSHVWCNKSLLPQLSVDQNANQSNRLPPWNFGGSQPTASEIIFGRHARFRIMYACSQNRIQKRSQ